MRGRAPLRFSFALNLGIFFRAIPVYYPIRNGPDPSVNLRDARARIEGEGFPWFRRFEYMAEVLRLLMEQDELPEVHGTKISPVRKHMIGYVAKSLGSAEIAGIDGEGPETREVDVPSWLGGPRGDSHTIGHSHLYFLRLLRPDVVHR